jgi:hypothetical protein
MNSSTGMEYPQRANSFIQRTESGFTEFQKIYAAYADERQWFYVCDEPSKNNIDGEVWHCIMETKVFGTNTMFS